MDKDNPQESKKQESIANKILDSVKSIEEEDSDGYDLLIESPIPEVEPEQEVQRAPAPWAVLGASPTIDTQKNKGQLNQPNGGDKKTDTNLKEHGAHCSVVRHRQATELAKVVQELYKPRGMRIGGLQKNPSHVVGANVTAQGHGMRRPQSSGDFTLIDRDPNSPMPVLSEELTHEEILETIMKLMENEGICGSEASSRSSHQRNSATSSQLVPNSTATSFAIKVNVNVCRSKNASGLQGQALAEIWTFSLTDGPAELSQHDQDSIDAAEETKKAKRRESLNEVEKTISFKIKQDYMVPDKDKIRSDQMHTVCQSVQKLLHELPSCSLLSSNYYSSEVILDQTIEWGKLGKTAKSLSIPSMPIQDAGKIKISVDYIEDVDIKQNIQHNANARTKSPEGKISFSLNQPPTSNQEENKDSKPAPKKLSNNPFLAIQGMGRPRGFTEDVDLTEQRRNRNQTRMTQGVPTQAFLALAGDQSSGQETSKNSNSIQTSQKEVQNAPQAGFFRRLSNAAESIGELVGIKRSRLSSDVSGPSGQHLDQSEDHHYQLSPPAQKKSLFARDQISQDKDPHSAQNKRRTHEPTLKASTIFGKQREKIQEQIALQNSQNTGSGSKNSDSEKGPVKKSTSSKAETSEKAGNFRLMTTDQNGNKTELPLQNSQLIEEKPVHSSNEMEAMQELPSSLEQSPEKQEGFVEERFSHMWENESEDSDCQDNKTSLGIMHLGADNCLKPQHTSRKNTASTKDGSYQEEDEFEMFQQSVRLLQTQIKESQSFFKDRQVTSSSKKDLPNLNNELKDSGSVVFILSENDKIEESNKSHQEKMFKDFIDVLKVQRVVSRTFYE